MLQAFPQKQNFCMSAECQCKLTNFHKTSAMNVVSGQRSLPGPRLLESQLTDVFQHPFPRCSCESLQGR